ncbi:uncharacterized protein RJT20DRAFT_125934 [Scheffersomyces xylosifermentans]|uniref:uncharacterized protein n=1 Tax=Scheffersomyces xylosifermentans TaxID=1304137 RepID=UPI00315CC6F0
MEVHNTPSSPRNRLIASSGDSNLHSTIQSATSSHLGQFGLQLQHSPSSRKEQTLKRFQENNDDRIYSEDFDLDDQLDLNLSYSRFSHISSSSSGIVRSNGSGSNHDSISESPFVKRIQGKVQVLFEHDQSRTPNSSNHYRTNLEEKSPENPMYPIEETSNEANDENDSPFIEKIIDKANLQIDQNHELNSHDLRQDQDHHNNQSPQKSLQEVPLKALRLRNNLITRDVTPTSLPPTPVLAVDSTPKKHQRNPSVKVSLTPAQRFEKRPGTRSTNALDNFKFSKLVGRGAFANVYKAVNLKTNQIIAIKQITLEKDQDVGGLMGEIDLLKILKHPNIVKYHGFVKTSSSLNILLEYCSGGSLRQLYKRLGHGLPEAQIIGYTRSILHGLNYLHEQGVVHRDVKAANVLLTEDGDIKLADFGVATTVTTQHHSVEGTPNWMAPETVLGGDGICTASDIWSLGATIIELFNTNPPYHDLNPMAALHAIGTDDHPPLPKQTTSLAKDFLLECFQKQASLRITAKLLLRHRWLANSANSSKTSMTNLREVSKEQKIELKSIASYSEMNEENWDKDFAEVKIPSVKPLVPDVIQISDVNGEFNTVKLSSKPKYTKEELLMKFSEKAESSNGDTESGFSGLHSDDLVINIEGSEKFEDESDPFLNIDIENFDTNELEIQTKMEYLVSKFTNRVDLCHPDNDEVTQSLIKITGRMLHMVKKYPISHSTMIRDHGVLSLLELLDSAQELHNHQKLCLHTLSILNKIFENDIAQFENFCLLGGIPAVTQFKSSKYDLSVRLQVVQFIGHFQKSEKALSMLISCGGLRVVAKFLEEDFDTTPTFPLASVDCIYTILSKDFTRSKSDLCRILAKYGVLFWFVVLLNRLTRIKLSPPPNMTEEDMTVAIDRIVNIVKYFGQAEARVRINISNVDLYKLLIKVYSHLDYSHQLAVLKFFKSMSCISANLKAMYKAELLEFLVQLLEKYNPSTPHYKEIVNIVAPILYNCCYLNHTKEADIVRLGVVPYLKSLSMINLPFRQFVLPLLCELVHCDGNVKAHLKKHDILTVYYNLLLDPYWQSNSLDSILKWAQYDPHYVRLDATKAQDCLSAGFMLPKVSNLEAALDNYWKLITTFERVGRNMANATILNNILLKLRVYNKNAVVQLTLLRILKYLVKVSKKTGRLENMNVTVGMVSALDALREGNGSVLVEELASEVLALL